MSHVVDDLRLKVVETAVEYELFGPPDLLPKKGVSSLRIANNDTISHTFKLRVKSVNVIDIQEGREFMRVIPDFTVLASGYIEDFRRITLLPDESLVVEMNEALNDAEDVDTFIDITGTAIHLEV